MSSSAWVENVTAGKEVSEAQSSHASVKLVPLDRFSAGNVVRESQFLHALVKLMSSSASVLKVTAGKEVKLAFSQSLHVLVKLVPFGKLSGGKEVRASQFSQQPEKLTPLDTSSVGKEGRAVQFSQTS